MWPCSLAGIALIRMKTGPKSFLSDGMTLIELVIVMAVIGILTTMAMPSYRGYMLRVHRTEAIRMLLQSSMCQQRVYASKGNYDTGQCHQNSEQKRYQVTYEPPNTLGQTYVAVATPSGAQLSDRCGSLTLDQNGTRGISAKGSNVIKCWNGR